MTPCRFFGGSFLLGILSILFCSTQLHPLPFPSAALIAQDPLPDSPANKEVLNANAEGQNATAPSMHANSGMRPIRRIFIPQGELPELTLDRMRPIELELLPNLLERVAQANAVENLGLDDESTTVHSLQAVARLVGRDLVSDRTRLRFDADESSSNTLNQRRRLAPWNLATEDFFDATENGDRRGNETRPSGEAQPVELRPSSIAAMRTDGNVPFWGNDEEGNPWIANGDRDLWADWSLRPESESGPNQLKYRLRIPRTTNGCLILQLPRKARVTSPDVTTIKLSDWNDVLARLADWPDRNPLNATPTPSGIDASFWCVELSGRSDVSLNVDLGSSELRSNSPVPSTEWGLDRLITKQAIQVSGSGRDLRIQYEWEWTEPPGEQPPFRLEMPEGYKLRSLQVNDREPPIEVDRNKLDVLIIKGAERPIANRNRMAAEFLYSAPNKNTDTLAEATTDPNPQKTLRVPPVLNRNAYVLAGTTILQDGGRSEFLAPRPSNVRLESARRNTEGSLRLEYSWFQNPPTLEFQVRERPNKNRLESFTRIAAEGNQIQAFVRWRIYFDPQTPECELNLPNGWTCDSSSLNTKPANVLRLDSPSTDQSSIMGTKLRVQNPGSASGEVILELTLRRELAAGNDLNLAQGPWFNSDSSASGSATSTSNTSGSSGNGAADRLQWIRADCLVVESTPVNQIELLGPVKPWQLPEEELSSWQRDLLPRLGKYVLLRIEDNRLPPLIVHSDQAKRLTPILTVVRKSDSAWFIEHQIVLTNAVFEGQELLDVPEFKVHLPANTQWVAEGHDGPLPLEATYDASSGDWLVRTENLSSANLSSANLRAAQSEFPVKILAREYRREPQMVSTPSDPGQSTEEQASGYIAQDLTSGVCTITMPWISGSTGSTWTIETEDSLAISGVPTPKLKGGADPVSREASLEQIGVGRDARGRYTIEVRGTSMESVSVNVVDPRVAKRDSRGADSRSSFLHQTSMHLVVDPAGKQSMIFDAEVLQFGSQETMLRWNVPNEWTDAEAIYQFRDGRTIRIPVEGDKDSSGVSVIVPKDSDRGHLQVRWIGPVLSPNSAEYFWQVANKWLPAKWFRTSVRHYALSWPAITTEGSVKASPERFLAYPKGIVLRGADAQATLQSSPSLLPFPDWFRSIATGWFPDRSTISKPFALPGEMDRSNLWERQAWPAAWDNPGKGPTLSNRSSKTMSIWASLLAIVLGVSGFKRWPGVVLVVALALALAMLFVPVEIKSLLQMVLAGLGIGVLLQRTMQRVSDTNPPHAPHRPSEIFKSWNLSDEERADAEQSPNPMLRTSVGGPAALSLWLIVGAAFIYNDVGQLIVAQDLLGEGPKVFDILIPVDEDNKVSGTTVYVPVELMQWAEEQERVERTQQGKSYILGAKHSIRFDGRSLGFAIADPYVTNSYEIFVGEFAVGKAIRIPYPAGDLKMTRFTVDGIEVLSSRLSRSDTELVWFPERSGKRLIQVESTTKLTTLESEQRDDRGLGGVNGQTPASGQSNVNSALEKPKAGWLVDLPVLPACNAVLDVETDGSWAVSIDAAGRSVNPSIGKSIVQMGNRPRMRIEFQNQPSPSARNAPMAMPGDLPTTTTETPTMNTELLIDRDQLIARTVLDVPRGTNLGNEIEIEADTQWAPIGSQWGDAQLVEIKSGSTLDRNRFVLRWKASGEVVSKSAEAQVSGRKVITTTWIPVGDAPLRSVLFAECRDRRVRQGTLRYSRVAGSTWGLDSISSWIPAINAKDRLDWPELREFPLSTNLRIPINSGFGVLRKQTALRDKDLDVDCSVFLGERSAAAIWRIQSSGPIGNQDPLLFSYPAYLKIDQISGANGLVEQKSWVVGDTGYTQVFFDRNSESVNEMRITASYALDSQGADAQNVPIPEMHWIGWNSKECRISLSADRTWTLLYTDSLLEKRSERGAGSQTPLWSGYISDESLRSMQLSAERNAWEGILVVIDDPNTRGFVFPAARAATSSIREDAISDLSLSEESQPDIDVVSKSIRLAGVSLAESPKPWQRVELSFPRDVRLVRPSPDLSRELPSMLWDQSAVLIDRSQFSGRDSDREPAPSESQIDFSIDLLPLASENNEGARRPWGSLRDIRVDGIRTPLWFVRSRGDSLAGAAQPESIGKPARMESDAAAKILVRLGLDPNAFELIREDSKESLSDLKPNAPLIQPTILLEAHNRTNFSIYSEFWFSREGTESSSTSSEPILNIELSVPIGCRPQWVCINGSSVPFVESTNGITLEFSHLGKLNYLEYWLENESRMERTAPSLRFGSQPSNSKGLDARRIYSSSLPANGTSGPLNLFELQVIHESQHGQDSVVQLRKYLSEAQSLALRLEQWERFLDSESLSRQERGVVNLAAKRSKACIDRLLKLTADGVSSNGTTVIGLSDNVRTADEEITVDFAQWGRLLEPYSTFDASLGLGGQSTSESRTTLSTSSTESVDHIDRFDRWTNRVHAPNLVGRWLNTRPWPQWVTAAISIILCISYLGICLKYQAWLQQRPWWDLLLLGLGWFAWTGSLWLGLAFCIFAAVVVCDTYWLISVRSRQNALRGPR
jgi:hypothetical protein